MAGIGEFHKDEQYCHRLESSGSESMEMSSDKSIGEKHHYIPKFYLKQWTDSRKMNGKLTEFSKPYQSIVAQKKVPDSTGYVRGLYSFDSLNSSQRDFMEKVFLQAADDTANQALQNLLNDNLNLAKRLRDGWSRFIMTLLHRNPERMNTIKSSIRKELPLIIEEAEREWQIKPSSAEEATELAVLMLMRNLMDSEMIGTAFNKMEWAVITLRESDFPFLTSDRPIMMTNGLDKPESHLALPISPTKIFLAANEVQTIRKIEKMAQRRNFPATPNNLIVRQAIRYVYGEDEKQIRFISNRFGERRQSTPLQEDFSSAQK